MNAIAIKQITALSLLIDFLFGVTVGVVGRAVYGLRRGALLAQAWNDPWRFGQEDPYRTGVRVSLNVGTLGPTLTMSWLRSTG